MLGVEKWAGGCSNVDRSWAILSYHEQTCGRLAYGVHDKCKWD